VSTEYVICLECESPCYVIEFKNDQLVEAVCEVCGNEDVAAFATEDEYEALASDERYTSDR